MKAPSEYREFADRIVKAIISDLTGRRGLRQEWESIDQETKEEIVASMTRCVLRIIKQIP